MGLAAACEAEPDAGFLDRCDRDSEHEQHSACSGQGLASHGKDPPIHQVPQSAELAFAFLRAVSKSGPSQPAFTCE